MSATITPTDDLQTSLGSQPDIERIYDNAQLVAPGAPLSLIKVCLWNTLEEFAIRSTCFRVEVAWAMPIGVSTVAFNPHSADMAVCWVLSQRGLVQWRVSAPAELVDLRVPTTARTGVALLALKPVSFESNLPAELWTNWFETILDGTLFRLYGQPNKPWMSTQLATYHGTRYRQGVNRARDIAARAWSNQQPDWRFPYFGRGRRR